MLQSKKHQNWIPGILNDLWGNEWVNKMQGTAPAINIIECETKFKVEIATPGMTKEDFSVEVKNENQLVVTIEKKHAKSKETKAEKEDKTEKTAQHESPDMNCDCDQEGRYLRHEFSSLRFVQTLILPDDVDKNKIKAKQENGILTIDLPKKAAEIAAKATKKISVE